MLSFPVKPGYVFPVEVLAKHGLDVESLHHGPDGYPIALQDVVHDIASQAYAHMERGRYMFIKIPFWTISHILCMFVQTATGKGVGTSLPFAECCSRNNVSRKAEGLQF